MQTSNEFDIILNSCSFTQNDQLLRKHHNFVVKRLSKQQCLRHSRNVSFKYNTYRNGTHLKVFARLFV